MADNPVSILKGVSMYEEAAELLKQESYRTAFCIDFCK